MGRGYAALCACRLMADHPHENLRIFNRGISGHRVPDLAERWTVDTLALKPDVVSLLIGVNDLWHKMDGRYDGSVDDFALGYTGLLERTAAALPNARLVLCEPFVLRCGAVSDRWFPEFDHRRAVVAALATRFETDFVPFQQVFDTALAGGSAPDYWATDGVHPTPAGHQLMADAWLRVVVGSAPAEQH
jgi:lysophospholipase L1-like esterase